MSTTTNKKQNVVKQIKKTTLNDRDKEELAAASEKKIKPKEKKIPLVTGTRTKTTNIGGASSKTTTTSLGVKNSKLRVPNSPTSNRVSKSQYFPNKSLYSNALNLNAVSTPRVKPAIPASLTKTKTVFKPKPEKPPQTSLAEVKKEMRAKLKTTRPKKQSNSSSSSSHLESERPKTATLKRPSIVNTNIVGPEASKLTNVAKIGKISKKEETDTESIPDTSLATSLTLTEVQTDLGNDDETEDNYEDDFDSYASDFEEYHSSHSHSHTSSEPVDVSTEGELSSSSSSSEAEEEKNNEESIPIKRVNSAEEERKLDSGNFDMEPKRLQVMDRIKENEPVNLSSLSDEGFEEAKTSLQFVNFADAKRKQQSGRKQQKRNKRGEELMSMIRLDQQNFTLFDLPAKHYDDFIKSFGNRNSTQVASQTGDDRIDEEIQTDIVRYTNKWTQFPIDKITKSKNPLQFREELLGVGSDTLEVNLLKEIPSLEYDEYNLNKFLQAQEKLIVELLKENQHGNNSLEMNTGKFPFSQGYFILNTEKYQATKLIAFSNSLKNSKIVTVHAMDLQEMKSWGLVWSLGKPNIPEDNFTAFGDLTDVTFGLDNDKLIFGGFQDGSLAVWDLLEDNEPSRPPSFLTDVNLTLVEPIVRVRCFRALKSPDFQVLTLNESGTIITWGLIIKRRESLGLNRLSLVKNNIVEMRQQHPELNLQCTDLCLNPLDSNHLFISTNYGLIMHSLISGTRTHPRQYSTGVKSPVNVLEYSPHNVEYYLAGCNSGEVVLLTRQFEKPLMTISNQRSDAAILNIQWSRNRPCIFYTHDSDNNINIWDLSVSELQPVISIHLKEEIRTMRISPNESDVSYMAVVTGDGRIHLHLLNQEHGMQEVEVYAEDLRKLNGYVQRL